MHDDDFAERLKDAGLRPRDIGSTAKEIRTMRRDGALLFLRKQLRDMRSGNLPEPAFVEIVYDVQRVMWEHNIHPQKFGSSDAELMRLERTSYIAQIQEGLDEFARPETKLERAGMLLNLIQTTMKEHRLKDEDIGTLTGQLAFMRRALVVRVEQLWKNVRDEPDLYRRRTAIRTLRRALIATKINPVEFGTTLYTIRHYREANAK